LRLIATDGHRLAYIQRRCRAAVAGNRGVIVPRRRSPKVRKLIARNPHPPRSSFRSRRTG